MTRFKLALAGVAAVLSLGAASLVTATEYPDGTVVTIFYPDGTIVR